MFEREVNEKAKPTINKIFEAARYSLEPSEIIFIMNSGKSK